MADERQNPIADGCQCSGCQGLRKRYASDPEMLDLYSRKLLIKSWSGIKDDLERAYIIAHAKWAQAAAVQGIRNLQTGG